jgi:mannose-6-phosphate isomerase-like protein (cupin superfamily)
MNNNSSLSKINLHQKFSLFNNYWSPKILAQLNGQEVKIAKVKGEFVWHNHSDEDELFFIIKGNLKIEFRDKTISLSEGEMLVVPKSVEHKPVADEEVWLLLFEPINTKHTGDIKHEITVEKYEFL